MIKLVFAEAADENSKNICRDYWQLEPDGEWTYKTNAIAKKFHTSTSKIAGLVKKSCAAYIEKILCLKCNHPMKVTSRAAYQETNFRHKCGLARLRNGDNFWCEECREENLRERVAKEKERIEQRNKTIDTWLQTAAKNLLPMDYINASVKDAFLLYGLISYSPERVSLEISSYSSSAPPLFAHPQDTNQAYIYLYEQGWIAPAPPSNRNLFDVSESGKISINSPVDVDWILAPDCNGNSAYDLLPHLKKRLDEPSSSDIKSLWSWVCLSELRALFENAHYRWSFRSNGWTPLVEKNMIMLLDQCSIGEAKAIVWGSMKGLASRLQDINYKKAHVYNMIPGSFLRFLNNIRGNGGKIFSWNRQSLADEAIFTSLLFDKLIGSGRHAYENYNGAHFEKSHHETSPEMPPEN